MHYEQDISGPLGRITASSLHFIADIRSGYVCRKPCSSIVNSLLFLVGLPAGIRLKRVPVLGRRRALTSLTAASFLQFVNVVKIGAHVWMFLAEFLYCSEDVATLFLVQLEDVVKRPVFFSNLYILW